MQSHQNSNLTGLKIGAAALNQTALDWQGNLARIRSACQHARDQGLHILCLPELSLTGYGCEDAFLADYVLKMSLDFLQQLAPDSQGLITCVGLPLKYESCTYNTMALLVDGVVHGFYAKQFLADNGVHYEPRWFSPWTHKTRQINLPWESSEKRILIQTEPFHVEWHGRQLSLGFEICEDAWQNTEVRPASQYKHVDIILNPNASHFAIGKQSKRVELAVEGSKLADCLYVHCNLLGNEAGRIIYDGEIIFANRGKWIKDHPPFSYQPYEIAWIELNQNQLTDKNTTHYPTDINVLFAKATGLGLYDYLRKSHAKGCVISLSGGADSAAVATIVHLMIEIGVASLGLIPFRESLDLSDTIDTKPKLHQALLTTVYQATQHSGPITRQAAGHLAEAIQSHHLNWDITEIVHGYHRLIEQTTEIDLNWQDHDLTLQNIQARARAPGVWMLANLKNALLLSTSNRSEAAVGYATMDGDTAGGLAPIAGIDKPFIRQWLRWMEQEGLNLNSDQKPYAISALSYINDQQPTAELRPQQQKQTDESDLMPYEVLELIEQLAIGQKRSPKAILHYLSKKYGERDLKILTDWVERFFRLWSRNQWKRERYAPAFHLDDRSLDPKTWCRFPILSGGFDVELRAIKEDEAKH